MEADGQQECYANEHGVVEVRDDGNRIHVGKSCCYEHLCAIGENALRETRGCVKNRRGSAGVYMKSFGYVFGNGTCCDDGNSVVRSTDVDEAC